MKLKTRIVNAISLLVAKITGGVVQDESAEILDGKVTQGMPELIRKAGAEGAVLLKNDGMLPFTKDREISVFGRVQYDYFSTGYGSGGDVKKPYVRHLINGIENCEELSLNRVLAQEYAEWVMDNEIDHGYWAHWPRSYPEMPLSDEIVNKARKTSNDAIIVLGRSSGEDRENALEEGSYYLKKEEKDMIDMVAKKFDNICLLLNIGSIMDLTWTEAYKDKIKAIMIVWQGGMESGNSIADLLSGRVAPSGRLADTIVRKYEDYPSSNDFGGKVFNNYVEDIYVGYRYFETFNKDAVLYPFGFGLGYSKFTQEVTKVEESDKDVKLTIKVNNNGNFKGKDVVQVYIQKPISPIDNPYRELVAYKKTKELQPGETDTLFIRVSKEQFASYDSQGVTGFKSAYVAQKGEYVISVGENVRDAKDVTKVVVNEHTLVKQLSELLAPTSNFNIIKNVKGKAKLVPVATRTTDLKKIILDNLPKDIPLTGNKGYILQDVKDGKVSMDDFVAQLSLDDLEAISRGDYTMNSPLGAAGNAGAIGGVTQSLRDKGIPATITTDGPSGIRLFASCSLIPIGALLACTFNDDLVEEIHTKISEEMKDRGSDILLAPGMNIHRNPLCGRNFEYYSEDPLLSGKTAAAAIRGIQSHGGSACPKHFACNNQEYMRTTNDSRVSERALREIYLKGFEIAIKEAGPNTIMTSYNKINGVWNHYNYELCKSVLRDEWGYDGLVMTDWWMQYAPSPEFPKVKSNGYRVRSRVNVLMPGGKRIGKKKPDGTLLATYGKKEGITLGEMQQNAKDVLGFLLKTDKLK